MITPESNSSESALTAGDATPFTGVIRTNHEERWQAWFAQLLEFRKKHGHLCVPTGCKTKGLKPWLREQCKRAKAGSLPPNQVRTLAEAGIDLLSLLTPQQQEWEEQFARLQAFQRQFGHCLVPKDTPEHFRLAQWIHHQRRYLSGRERQDGKLHRFEKVLGETLKKPRRRRQCRVSVKVPWEVHFAELAAFKARFGHCRIPNRWPENTPLSQWYHIQCYWARRGVLDAGRQERLVQLGVEITPTQQQKQEVMLSALAGYQARFGDGQVPPDWPENTGLAQWLNWQRHLWRKGTLPAQRVEQLTRFGVRPEQPRRFGKTKTGRKWDRMIDLLRRHKERLGHCTIPHAWPEDQALANWMHAQRRLSRSGKLHADREAHLTQLGVDFSHQPHTDSCRALGPSFIESRAGRRWKACYYRLEKFQREHGHCRVPADAPRHRLLYGWLQSQRCRGRAGLLNADMMHRLQSLGVCFKKTRRSKPSPEGPGVRWEQRFEELVKFKKRFGHCQVPVKWPENVPLACWIVVQRRKINSGQIQPGYRRKLEELGVLCGYSASHWLQRYDALKEFRRQHGHCRVPRGHSGHLDTWSDCQRGRRLKGTLDAARFRLLDALGFSWKRRPPVRPRADKPAATSSDSGVRTRQPAAAAPPQVDY